MPFGHCVKHHNFTGNGAFTKCPHQEIRCNYGIFHGGMYSYITQCTRFPSVRHLYMLLCYPCAHKCHLYVTPIHSYVMVLHTYVPECHPYVTSLYSFVKRISFLCTGMSSVFHLYVIRMSFVCTCMLSLCHSCVVLP